MRIFIAMVLMLAAVPARANPVRLEVKTAAASDAWQLGRASPFVAKITGIGLAAVRIDCHGSENSFVRAHNVRDGVAARVVSDFAPRTIPKPEDVDCTAYDADRAVATWRGTLAWPNTTLPDHRVTAIDAKRCGERWCVDVMLDRNHPGTVGAEVSVLCTMRHVSADPLFIAVAPWSREQVTTAKDQASLSLADAPGATAVQCSVDRDLDNNSRFADADPTNNEFSTTVVNTSTPRAKLIFVNAESAITQLGCGNCSTHMPGKVVLSMRIKNQGPAVNGIGVRCKVDVDRHEFQLLGASGAIPPSTETVVRASIQYSTEVANMLVGERSTRCEAIVWDQPSVPPATWNGTVAFSRAAKSFR